MARRLLLSFAVWVAVLAASPFAVAQVSSYGKAVRLPRTPDVGKDVGVEQKLGETVPMLTEFYDHEGKAIALKDCIGGKPTILILAYYSCPKLCTEVLNGLVGEMRELSRSGYVAGRDYNVVTVSINPKESPPFARMKRQSYLNDYDQRPETEAGWWFLSANQGQGTNVKDAQAKIDEIANAVGFKYEVDPSGKDFIHPSTIIILTPEGKISRYLHNLAPQDYTAKDIKFSMIEASNGKMGKLSDRMAILCFAYDEMSGKYTMVAMRAMGLLALPFPFLIGWIAYAAWKRSKVEKKIVRTDDGTGTDLK